MSVQPIAVPARRGKRKASEVAAPRAPRIPAAQQYAAPRVQTAEGLIPAPVANPRAVLRAYINERKNVLAWIRGAKRRSLQLLGAIRQLRPPRSRPRRPRLNV